MPLDLLMALAGYVTAMSVTPGPNNVMLLTSGVNSAFAAPSAYAGIALGVLTILALVGSGAGAPARDPIRASTPHSRSRASSTGLARLEDRYQRTAGSRRANAQAQVRSPPSKRPVPVGQSQAWAMGRDGRDGFHGAGKLRAEPARHGLRLHRGQPAERRRLDRRRHHGARNSGGARKAAGLQRGRMAILLLASSLPIVWDLVTS